MKDANVQGRYSNQRTSSSGCLECDEYDDQPFAMMSILAQFTIDIKTRVNDSIFFARLHSWEKNIGLQC